MFSKLFTSVALGLAINGGVLAAPVANSAASGSTMRRQTGQHRGVATFFFQNNTPGACGTIHKDSDHVVALQTEEYANGAHCGKTIIITDTDNGITTTGIVADECPSCGAKNNIDLSTGLFDVFANEDLGVIPVVWEFA